MAASAPGTWAGGSAAMCRRGTPLRGSAASSASPAGSSGRCPAAIAPSEREREPLADLLGSVVAVGPQRADDPQHVSGIDLIYWAVN